MLACARCSLALALLLMCAGCDEDRRARPWRPSDHQPPSAEQNGQEEPGQVEEGGVAALYEAACAACHGVEGRGDGPAMPPGASVDLSSNELQSARSDEELARVIRGGRGMMPAFGTRLGEAETAALVAHVRTLRAQ